LNTFITPTNSPIPPTSTPTITPTLTPVPVLALKREDTTKGKTVKYSENLQSVDQVIIGDAYSGNFPKGSWLCSAFLIRGPGEKTFTITDGTWTLFSGVITQEKINELLSSHVENVENSNCLPAKIVEY
jgi:hypothetical protein